MSKNRELADVIGTQGTTEQVLSGRRNLIINGGFDVWQRGTVFSGNSYNADRWYSYLSNASVTYANTLNDGNYVHIAVNSGTSIATIEQRLENPAQYHNKTLTLSYNVFGTPTATNGLKYEIALNHDGGRTVINSGSASVGAGRKVLTFSVGDLSGYTLSSSSYLEIRPLIYYQENTWTGAIGISEVQLELGSVATPFEHRSYGEELALCQRYYEYGYGFHDASGTYIREHMPFMVAKRVPPSVTVRSRRSDGNGGNIAGYYYQVGTDKSGASASNITHLEYRFNVNPGYTANADIFWRWEADAEL